jgi:hypothetical protein
LLLHIWIANELMSALLAQNLEDDGGLEFWTSA